VICNSSDLADRKNLPAPSDVAVLGELGHRDKVRIVERLSRGKAQQKELAKDLDLQSGTLSRWLGELVQARIISQARQGRYEVYWLIKPERTNELLDIAAKLAIELSAAQLEADEAKLREREERDPAAEGAQPPQ
jgi:DNA-binding transcriptional ArsR family regulator